MVLVSLRMQWTVERREEGRESDAEEWERNTGTAFPRPFVSIASMYKKKVILSYRQVDAPFQKPPLFQSFQQPPLALTPSLIATTTAMTNSSASPAASSLPL